MNNLQAKLFLMSQKFQTYSKLILIFLMMGSFFGSSLISFSSAQPSCTSPGGSPNCVSASSGSSCSSATLVSQNCTLVDTSICPSGQYACVPITYPVCSIYLSVKTVIFILGLTLMLLGGALYAGSHVMPGQHKGSMQGYGMGMIMGGIIGVIIAVIAPTILGFITGNSSIASTC